MCCLPLMRQLAVGKLAPFSTAQFAHEGNDDAEEEAYGSGEGEAEGQADLGYRFIEWDSLAGETDFAVGGGTCELEFGLLVAEGLDGLPGEVALLGELEVTAAFDFDLTLQGA